MWYFIFDLLLKRNTQSFLGKFVLLANWFFSGFSNGKFFARNFSIDFLISGRNCDRKLSINLVFLKEIYAKIHLKSTKSCETCQFKSFLKSSIIWQVNWKMLRHFDQKTFNKSKLRFFLKKSPFSSKKSTNSITAKTPQRGPWLSSATKSYKLYFIDNPL